MKNKANGENVVFLGPPGVGKAHLASALGLMAAQHRFSIYFINCHLLIEQLKKAHFLFSYAEKQQNFFGIFLQWHREVSNKPISRPASVLPLQAA